MSDAYTPSTGQEARAAKLIKLAEAEFGWDGLSEPERKVIRCAAIGVDADFTVDTKGYEEALENAIAAEDAAIIENDTLPPASKRPVPDVKLSAEAIRWLLTDVEAAKLVDATGIQICSVTIQQRINLEHFDNIMPLVIINSYLPNGINLLSAHCKHIDLSGSLVCSTSREAINAKRISVVGSIFLNRKFRAEGEVVFNGAKIGRNINCINGRFVKTQNRAISTDSAEIEGNIFLSEGFSAYGEVRMVGTKIGSSLDCEGGQFSNTDGVAIRADRIRVTGSVFFRNCFYVNGQVQIPGAQIGSNLDCSRGSFFNPYGQALYADGICVGGDVFLNNNFKAVGEVRMKGSQINGLLSCSKGIFCNTGKNGSALILSGATIGGGFLLSSAKFKAGALTLVQCATGYLVDDEQWPKKLRLTAFNYEQIHSRSPTDAQSRLKWLAIHDNTAGDTIPDPQPYRHLADVLKKQGHEDDARTVLRVCAERRMWPLAKRALHVGPVWPRWYLGLLALVLVVLNVAFYIAEQEHAASTMTYMLVGWAVVFAALASMKEGIKDAARCIEAARVFVTQWLYRLVVGHGYARWRAVACAFGLTVLGTAVFGANSAKTMQESQARALMAHVDLERANSGDADLNETERNELRAANEWVEKYPAFDPVVYSADTLIPLVSLKQEGLWTPSGRGPWGWFIKNIYLPFHIAMGWVIATLFVASFTKLMRQEG